MTEYDLVIIGGGAGAFAAAIRANELQAETALMTHSARLRAHQSKPMAPSSAATAT